MLPPVFPDKKGFLRMSFYNKNMKELGGYSTFFIIEKKYQPKKNWKFECKNVFKMVFYLEIKKPNSA